MTTETVAAFSKTRLGGEPLPLDLETLLLSSDALYSRTGVSIGGGADWAPWLDTSYLSEADKRNPDIIANVRAIADVCGLITFVAMHEDAEYIGYWRGPSQLLIANSPLVVLDNEGQFRICAGPRLVECLLERTYDNESFMELRSWFQTLGIVVPATAIKDLAYPAEPSDPDALHLALYTKYRGA